MLKKIVKYLMYIFTLVLVAYFFTNLFLPSKVIDIFGFKIYNVASTSMQEKYPMYSSILAIKTNKKTLNKGDVITFKARESINGVIDDVVITHYVGNKIVINDEILYQTQTYHNYHNDGEYDDWYNENNELIDTISSDQVIGKVVFAIPLIGAIGLFYAKIVANPILLGLVIVIVLSIVLIAYSIKKMKDEA